MVVFVNHNNLRHIGFCFFLSHEAVSDDDNSVANQNLACCCTVQADYAAATLTSDNIGFQTVTVVVVYDLYALARQDTGQLQQLAVDSDAAHIFQVSLGYSCAMNFAMMHCIKHIIFPPKLRYQSDGLCRILLLQPAGCCLPSVLLQASVPAAHKFLHNQYQPSALL